MSHRTSIRTAALVLLWACQAEVPPLLGAPPPGPVPAFHVSVLTPNQGTATGGSTVFIEGGGFETGATVLFGVLPALGQEVSSPELMVAVTPPSPSGSVDVTVRNPDGTTAVAPGGFTFEP